MTDLSNWLEIGKIVGAQGLKGEVRVYPDSDFPQRFEDPGPRWLLKPGSSTPEPIELVKGRLHGKGIYVIQFSGVTDRTQAENLQGARLFVPADDRPDLEDGEFHVRDLIGLPVFLQDEQTLLGEVVDVIAAGNDLLEVKLHTNPETIPSPKPATVLIPFVEEIVPIVDLELRRIEITPPTGLLNL